MKRTALIVRVRYDSLNMYYTIECLKPYFYILLRRNLPFLYIVIVIIVIIIIYYYYYYWLLQPTCGF
jgi:hypothetical protein